MPSITPGELVREAIRSIGARPWLSVLASVAIGLLCLGAVMLEAHALRSLVDTRAAQIDAGANVLVIDADGARIPAAPCDALQRSASALAVGAVQSTSAIRLAGGGAFSFQLALVSDGYLRVTAPGVRGAHTVAVGDAVQDTLGIGAGSTVGLDDGRSLRVGASLPESARTPDRDRWLFEVAPIATDDTIVECWVESAPGALLQLREEIPALFAAVGDLRVRSLVSGDVLTAAEATYEHRITRWAWIPAALICAGLLVIALRARQPEYALYRIVGISVTDVALMFTIEAWMLTMPTVIAFLGAGIGYLSGSGNLTREVFIVVGGTIVLCTSAIEILVAMMTPLMWRADLPRYLKGRG